MRWHIANTTVRTPYRLRDALIALQGSQLHGNLCGRDNEHSFARLLHDRGILNAPRLENGEDASDLGRKWRSALSQLGFLTPKLTRVLTSPFDPKLSEATRKFEGLSGRPFEITPNGYRLIESSSLTAQQECFLRSLAVYRIPSLLERNYELPSFSPLQFVLQLLHELETTDGVEPFLSFQEISFFVERHTPSSDIQVVTERILEYRRAKTQHQGVVRKFDNDYIKTLLREECREIATEELMTMQNTLIDYADLIVRYLKATGLFKAKGRGITLSPAKMTLAHMLRDEPFRELDGIPYLQALWTGAELPTDDREAAATVIEDLVHQISTRGAIPEISTLATDVADLSVQRHMLEDQILRMDEEEYASRQSGSIQEILAWLDVLLSRRTVILPTGEEIAISRGEAPAYLEWAIWRAFLAINSLCNKPWEARRFQIDQDFLPIGTAPGGGPDMVFVFENMIIVVEVTLTSSSRQEAAEGEPVRRHVAKYAEQQASEGKKMVYGLFIAIDIDTNTAHTFRSGDWYLQSDEKINLDIVPLQLKDFQTLLRSGGDRLSDMPRKLEDFLIRCRAKANQDAPKWKIDISTIVKSYL